MRTSLALSGMMEEIGKLWVTVVLKLMVPICVSGTEFHSTGLGSGPVVELQRLLKAVVSSFMWNWMVEHSMGEDGPVMRIFV